MARPGQAPTSGCGPGVALGAGPEAGLWKDQRRFLQGGT